MIGASHASPIQATLEPASRFVSSTWTVTPAARTRCSKATNSPRTNAGMSMRLMSGPACLTGTAQMDQGRRGNRQSWQRAHYWRTTWGSRQRADRPLGARHGASIDHPALLLQLFRGFQPGSLHLLRLPRHFGLLREKVFQFVLRGG